MDARRRARRPRRLSDEESADGLQLFADVPADAVFADAWAKATGLTRGCNPPENTRFCPDQALTRGQIAAFLDRADSLPATDQDFFGDDDDSIFEAAINRLAASGITSGCGEGRFCPDDEVTREQMVTFLYRARNF